MFQSVLGLVGKLVRTITLRRVLTWAAAGFISIIGITIYENRKIVFSDFFSENVINPYGTTFQVGTETRDRIEEIVNRFDDIVGIMVMSADLRLNEAHTLHFYSKSTQFVVAHDASQRRGNDIIPIFTNLEENNAEMVKAVNGEFGCVAFDRSLMGRLYPQLSDEIKQVCRASIPSYYGHFSGYLTVFLRVEDTFENGIRLNQRQAVEKLATDIYFRDVLTTTKRIEDQPKPLK